MTTTPILSTLPTLITETGDYITRSEKRVTIFEILPPIDGESEVTRFRAKGSIWKMFRGKIRPRGFNIWHVSGRFSTLNTHPLDIVESYSAGEPNR
jgi:hypothetical protein